FSESPEDEQHVDKEREQLSALLVNLSQHDRERLYADYIEHCFPSFYLSRDSFLMYMAKHEIEIRTQVAVRYYAAFRIRAKHYMTFTELLLGLAAIDLRTDHKEARYKFVFRYYDSDKDGALNRNEFKRMYEHL